MGGGIARTQPKGGLEFFAGLLHAALLIQGFSEGAVDVGNLGVCLLQGGEAICAGGDLTCVDHRFRIDVVDLGGEVAFVDQ